jgi:hypothetical protein
MPRLGYRTRLTGTFLKVVHMTANTSKTDYEAEAVNLLALDRAGMPTIEVTMKLQRLSFLPRLMRRAPPYLLVLPDETPSYRRNITADLVWLAATTPKVAALPEPHLDLATWLDMCRLHGWWWKTLLKQVRAQLSEDQHVVAAVAATGDPEDTIIADLVLAHAVTAVCNKCGASFRGPIGERALRMHARMTHGVRSPALAAAHGTSCPPIA